LQAVFAGTVALVGVRVQSADQFGIAGADLRAVGVFVQVQVGQGVAFDLAQLAGLGRGRAPALT
jgi:hypothetical protein